MYIFKNAMKNIYRNKGRNILIGIIILGIIVSTVVAFSINTTTDEIIKDYKNRFGSEVTLAPDMDKLMNQSEDKGGMMAAGPIEAIKTKQYFDFAESEYLKESIFTSEFGAVSKTLKAIDEDEDEDAGNGLMISKAIGPDGKAIESAMPNLKIIGNSTLELLEEFKSGKRKIIDGEMYKEKDECIVSQEFAELNNIKVGEFIEVNKATDENGDAYKLKVTGIYFDSTNEYSMPFKQAAMNKRNEILINLETAQGMSGDEELYIQAKYYLKNPDMIKNFEEEVRAKGLPDMYNVTTDEESYNKIVGPVEGLGSITLMFVLVVLGLGSVILILLNTLSIRERKYEIGVLRAIGMKKGKVAIGLISESLIITAICLVIGIGAGSVLSQPVSNSLLQKQIEAQKTDKVPSQGFRMAISNSTGSASEDTISEIDVTLNGKAILEVTGVALLIALVSSVVGVSYITKYEPRKILTERG
ncbi:ABC transporter permease [Clostridium gasigenes]|uniref:ABC transporter permease n=1 Tax=Clostridium gasigenes TaxID=94869 RepID=UPI001C0CB54C|nr:FtsX-like permease family protein [Clostridium gasigenes]MBU3103655.1 FtsX-like permease family protein [Clostridium gasigenes]